MKKAPTTIKDKSAFQTIAIELQNQLKTKTTKKGHIRLVIISAGVDLEILTLIIAGA